MAAFSFRQLVRGTFFYTLLGFLPLAARLVLFPVFVRYLSAYDYGLISLTNTLTSALTIVAVFGLESAFSLYYFSYRRTPELLRTYFSTLLTTVLGLGVALLGLGWAFGPLLVDAMFKDPAFTYLPYGQIAVVVAVTSAVNALVLSYYRNSQQPAKFFAVAMTSFVLSIAAEAVAILVLKQGAAGVLLARLLGAAVVALGVIGYVYASGGVRFSVRMLRRSLLYGLPVVLYLFFGFVYNSYDRVLIENYLDVTQVAVFSLGFTIASVIEMVMQSVQSATYPVIYENLKRHGSGAMTEVNRLLRLQGWAMLFIGALVRAPTPLFVVLFVKRPEYLPAIELVPWLIVGFLMRYFYVVWTTPVFYYSRYTKRLPLLNIVCGVAVVVFNILLLPRYGLAGAAVAMVLARGIQLAVAWWLYSRQGEMRFALGPVPWAFGVAMLGLVALGLLPIDGLWLQTAVYAAPTLLLTAGGAVVWWRVLGPTLRPDWSRLKAAL